MNKRIFLGLLTVVVLLVQCRKDAKNITNNDFFTPVNVDFYINLDLPLYANLNFPNGWVYELNQGYKQRGVIVYNTGFTGPDQYVAFDRSCPVKVDSSCAYVSVDSSTLYYRCGQYSGVGGKFVPCCGSRFLASTGTQQSGPADRPLRQYYVTHAGSTLHVTNFPQ